MTYAASPQVTVLMTVFNGEKYLKEAVESILDQTFKNFELLVVNDGSTDQTASILQNLQSKDPRIRVLEQENRGIVFSANRGIQEAKGKYIARMDSDDWSFSDRLRSQVDFLDRHPDIVMVAGAFEVMDSNGEVRFRKRVLLDPVDLEGALWVRNPIGHGSVMYRTEAVRSIHGYRGEGQAEDYEIYSRLVAIGKIAGLPQLVYKYRIHSGSVTSLDRDKQMKMLVEYIERRWRIAVPEFRDRKFLIHQYRRYLSLGNPSDGKALADQMLDDNLKIGLKMIKHGHYWAGCRQVFSVASLGRVGLKGLGEIIKHKIRRICKK